MLLIDVQKDFHPGGSLAVPTADADAVRIAAMIRRHATEIDRIIATMDSHQKLHIAHPSFWVSTNGMKQPDPFTIISAQDIRDGTWKPRPDLQVPLDASGVLDHDVFGSDRIRDSSGNLHHINYCIEYANRLEEKGRFQICIWPEHCLIGSEGHTMVNVVKDALHEWGEKTGRSVEWLLKGQSIWTEMYSAIEAEVPVSKATSFNDRLHSSLLDCDRLLVCGQTMSHCVNYTVRDIVKKWPKEHLHKIWILTDCSSAVPGFEAAAKTFQRDMAEAGVRLMKSSDV